MKRPPFSLVATFAALVLASCSTVESRIGEKSAAFAALDEPTQQKLRQSIIEVGYSPDLVYIALGAPSEKLRKTTGLGAEETWVYRSYYEEWAGQVLSHYQRWVSYDSNTKRYYVSYEPVYADVYRAREEELIRVSFLDGKVSAIEQNKKPDDPRASSRPPAASGQSV